MVNEVGGMLPAGPPAYRQS